MCSHTFLGGGEAETLIGRIITSFGKTVENLLFCPLRFTDSALGGEDRILDA